MIRCSPAPTLLALLIAAVLAVALTACGADDAPPRGPAAGTGGAFPVTIEHARGSTTIEREPQRVVTLGWSDQDPVLALGVKPVGTTEWFNEQPGAIFPWARKAAASARPQIVSAAGEIDYEKLAALRLDLILAMYEDLDGSEYRKLSQLAPTIAHAPGRPFGDSWQNMTLTAGRALGREPRAKALVAGVERRLAQVRADHPAWARQTALVMATVSSGSFQVFAPDDPKMRFMAALGFRTRPPWISGRVHDNAATVSAEEIRLLDVDRLAWTSDPETISKLERNRLYQRLDVVRDGRVSYLDYTKPPFPGAAVTFNTVLSIPYALDLVVPELERTSR